MLKDKVEDKTETIIIKESCIKDIKNNQEYRYLLTKEWGKADNSVAVIMYNPSGASLLMYDKTVMNVENYFKKKGFNKIKILNLYAIKGKNSSIVSKRNEDFEELNDDYIRDEIKDINKIFLAWGYGKINKANYVKERIKLVEEIIKNYADDNKIPVRAFARIKDGEIIEEKCHPQNLNIDTWTDIEYKF